MNSRVSVITPVYNSEKYLEKCIKSIQDQTYSDFELVLSDDGSFDRSGLFCDEFALQDDRLIIIHKKNGGQSEARNYALDLISGEYVYFCDSDDWIESDLIMLTVQTLESNNVDLVRFHSYIHYLDGTVHPTNYDFHDEVFQYQNKFELIYYYVMNYKMGYELWLSLFKTCFFKEYDIRFPIGINVAEDLYVIILYLLSTKSAFLLNKTLYHYFVYDNSTMRVSQERYMLNHYNTLAMYIYNSCNEVIRQKFFLIHSKFIYGELCKIMNNTRGDYRLRHRVFDSIEYKDFYIESCTKMVKYGKQFLINEYGYYVGMLRLAICEFALDHSTIKYLLRKTKTEVIWFPCRVKNKIIRVMRNVKIHSGYWY